MPLLSPEYLPGLPMFTRRFFEELCALLPRPSVMVFDNYQKVPPESMLHDVIRDAATSLPPDVNMILISRSAPPPAFAPLRANNLSQVIGWEEMRLTAEETKGIIRLHGKRPFRGDRIRSLDRIAEGWAAGLVLLLRAAGTEAIDPGGAGFRSPVETFAYFEGEIFAKTDVDTRNFLLGSSFLPRMTAGMAQRLTGNDEAGDILSGLCRSNHFTQVHPNGDPVYQYHALYREFLLSRAKETLGWAPQVSLREGLTRTIAYFREVLEKGRPPARAPAKVVRAERIVTARLVEVKERVSPGEFGKDMDHGSAHHRSGAGRLDRRP